mmetsp:Transcript_4060/g.12617  ORF Transcript_4060/g.12617 Transcript_4060/m.12617 type:complete len:202 (-) Transcript_4060:307-912(-)
MKARRRRRLSSSVSTSRRSIVRFARVLTRSSTGARRFVCGVDFGGCSCGFLDSVFAAGCCSSRRRLLGGGGASRWCCRRRCCFGGGRVGCWGAPPKEKLEEKAPPSEKDLKRLPKGEADAPPNGADDDDDDEEEELPPLNIWAKGSPSPKNSRKMSLASRKPWLWKFGPPPFGCGPPLPASAAGPPPRSYSRRRFSSLRTS